MLSVTDLSTFEYCPRKLFINKVLGLKEPYNINTIKGIILHKVIEKISNKENSTRIILKEEIKKNHIQLKKFGQGLVDFYHESLPGLIWEENLLSKRDYVSEVTLESEKMGLKGRIDLLQENTPIEIKTGSAPRDNEVWPAHQLQLGTYLMILRESDSKVSEGQIHYIKNQEVRSVILNPFLEKKILKIKKKSEEITKNLNPPKILDEEYKCNSCAFKAFCHDENKVNERINMIKKSRV